MIIDICIILTIIIAVLIGKKVGLIKYLVSMCSLILSLVLALILCRPLGNFLIQNTQIDEKIKEGVISSIGVEDIELDTDNKLPESFNKYLNKASEDINESKDKIQDNMATKISRNIVYVISYVLVFIIAKVIILVLSIVGKIVEKLPVLKQANEIGGMVCGAVYGVLIIYIAISIFSAVSPVLKENFITNQINKGYVGRYIYNNNIVVKSINK